MRRATVLLIAIFSLQLSLFSCQVFAAAKILAIVNNDAITEKDVADLLAISKVQLSRQYKGKQLEEKVEALKKDILQQLIDQRLILQQAEKSFKEAVTIKDKYAIFRLQVKKDQISSEMKEIKGKYSSEEEFQRDLDKDGLTQADIENRIREQLTMQNMIEYAVKEVVKIRPEEVTDFYNKNLDEFDSGEDREFIYIILDNNDLATSLSFDLKSGKEIEELATRYPFVMDNMIANKKKANVRKEIEDIVFKMGIDEVSNPAKIDSKYYVFILKNIVPSKKLSLSEAQPQIYNYLRQLKMQEDYKKWLEELRKISYIKIF
jgi:parvulin-like peptidyl-prolyl isomerase